VVEAGGTVIADFICPAPDTRAGFGNAFTIWLDRLEAGRFEDTNRMFVAPDRVDLHVTAKARRNTGLSAPWRYYGRRSVRSVRWLCSSAAITPSTVASSG
jgi:hypothetical protein